jgi:CRP-like cAMP-binding protein
MHPAGIDKLKEAFGEIARLSFETEQDFIASIDRMEVKKKTILQEEGRFCNHVYFIEKGMARTFYIKDGKDVTYWIAGENEFVGAMGSFFSRTVSNKNVETLEDCILWEFNYNRLEELYAQSKEMERMGRLFACYGIALQEKRFDDLHCMTARERYDLLLQNHPQIIQRVPLGIIASYLGITQETLSRIRQQH